MSVRRRRVLTAGPQPDRHRVLCHRLEHCPAVRPPGHVPKLGLLPVQNFIPALHVKPEMRKGNGDGTVFPSNEVPGSVICHFFPFLSVLPAPLALLVPGRLGRGQDQGLWESRAAWGRDPSCRVHLHGLHVGFGQVEGPIHGGWLQSRHSLTFDGDI